VSVPELDWHSASRPTTLMKAGDHMPARGDQALDLHIEFLERIEPLLDELTCTFWPSERAASGQIWIADLNLGIEEAFKRAHIAASNCRVGGGNDGLRIGLHVASATRSDRHCNLG
jgi:hypothetical protein